jgi:hypothetical protein
VLLNTLIKLCTVVINALKAIRYRASPIESQVSRNSSCDFDRTLWTTVKTTNLRWEAKLMQQVLAAHEIPARIVDLGIEAYMGQGSPAALQVCVKDEQSAIFLLSSVDEAMEASD